LKKQLDGNPEQPSPPESFVIFLDETLHNCRPILEALTALSVAHERHGNYFQPGTPDEEWLPMVGEKNWILLTHDQKIRYNELEVRQIIRHKVREFVFTSGNLTGPSMAEALLKALPKMKGLAENNEPPFIANISKSGNVEIRYDKHGSVHDRKKTRKPS
jgi:hypothetical protein